MARKEGGDPLEGVKGKEHPLGRTSIPPPTRLPHNAQVEIGDWRSEMKIGEAKYDVEDWRLEMEIGDLTGSGKICL